MTVGTVVLNTTGNIVYANRPFLRRSGFALEQAIDRRPNSLWGGHMERSAYQTLWNTLEQGKAFVATFSNKSKQSSWYTSHLHIIPLTNQQGEDPYYVGIDTEEYSSKEICSKEFLQVWNGNALSSQKSWWKRTFESSLGPQEDIHQFVRSQWVDSTAQKFSHRYEDYSLIALAQGDSEQFSVLYKKYYESTYQYLFAKVRHDHSLAEELTQETFLQAFRYVEGYVSGYASYQTYLYRVANSRLVSYLRKKREVLGLEEISEPFIEDIQGVQAVDLALLLTQAKDIVSRSEYQACVAFYIHQESVRDISIGMGKSCNAVKLLLSRARKKLAKNLSQK